MTDDKPTRFDMWPVDVQPPMDWGDLYASSTTAQPHMLTCNVCGPLTASNHPAGTWRAHIAHTHPTLG